MSTGRHCGTAAAWALLRAEALKIAEPMAVAASPATEPPASRKPWGVDGVGGGEVVDSDRDARVGSLVFAEQDRGVH